MSKQSKAPSKKYSVLGRQIPRTALLGLLVMALAAGGVVGAILYNLSLPTSISVGVNTYGISAFEDEAMTIPVTSITFDSLMADVPGAQVVDVFVWVAPNQDPSAQAILLYMNMDLSGIPAGLVFEAGYFDPTYNAIIYDGSTSFYTFPSGWTDSVDDPMRIRWRLTCTDVPEGSYGFDIEITGEDA